MKLENYKVRVENIAEADHVQQLFENIGYKKGELLNAGFPKLVVAVCDRDGKYSSGAQFYYSWHKCQEITIDQLRELVAAKTNKIPTHPEELPFIDDEPKRDDNVNHPSHYTQGSIECIEALEAATVNKQGIEAVCVANVIKYLWRYESKNDLEDVKKAQWYLQKLVDKLEQNNG